MKKSEGILKSYLIKVIIIVILTAISFVACRNDAFLYDKTVGTITDVKEKKQDIKTSYDGSRSYEEVYFEQTIEAKIENGEYEGKKVTLKNIASSSSVYDVSYEKGDQIFIEEGRIGGAKRDYINITLLIFMISMFLLVGGREGMLTIGSLGLNIVGFFIVIKLYFSGFNILFMAIPMVVLFGYILLLFMERDRLIRIGAFAAFSAALLITVIFSVLSIYFSGKRIDFDYLAYLIQPYEYSDAMAIYLSQIAIGVSGAVLDVVITILYTLREVNCVKENLSIKEGIKSCKNVGDKIIGTMLPVLFFTNIASSLPFVLLCLRNGFNMMTILRYNMFFELSRFLLCGIGTVLAVPCAAVLGVWILKKYGKRKAVTL